MTITDPGRADIGGTSRAASGPVANFSRRVYELHEKATWPKFWL